MMKRTTPLRPAMAAIAAVLAFSATPLLAQEIAPQSASPAQDAVSPVTASPVAAPPVVATQPDIAPASAPVRIAAPSPVVQPMPAPAPAPIEAAPAPAAHITSRPVAKVAVPKAAPVAIAAAPAPAPVVASPVTAAPVEAAPVESAPVEAAPVQPAVQSAPASIPDNAPAPWAVLAGAAALIGIGGVFALRRRKPVAQSAGTSPAYADHMIGADSAASVAAAPAHAVAPETASRWTDVPTVKPTSLNAMVAQAPSPENPFLTRKNRLRRAAFLIRQQTQQDSAPPVATPAPAPAMQAPRPSPVYDFGRGITVRRGFKPLTS